MGAKPTAEQGSGIPLFLLSMRDRHGETCEPLGYETRSRATLPTAQSKLTTTMKQHSDKYFGIILSYIRDEGYIEGVDYLLEGEKLLLSCEQADCSISLLRYMAIGEVMRDGRAYFVYEQQPNKTPSRALSAYEIMEIIEQRSINAERWETDGETLTIEVVYQWDEGRMCYQLATYDDVLLSQSLKGRTPVGDSYYSSGIAYYATDIYELKF